MSADPAPRRVRLCVVSPCYNEEAVVAMFHRRMAEVLDGLDLDGMKIDWRLLLVDDGSRDGTLAAIEALAAADPRVVPVALSRNFGHQLAITAGLDVARGDAVVVLDSDLQHPPELIATLLARWRAGSEVVIAVRTDTADAGPFKRLSSRLFYTCFNALSDTRIVPGAADFYLLSAEAHRALRRLPERHRFLRGMVAWIGFPRAEVPYTAQARAAGHSKYSLRKMVALALEAVFSFSVKPLRLAMKAGLLSAGAGLVYLVWVLYAGLFNDAAARGWASLMCVLLVLGGLQLVCLGIVGEYLGKVLEEGKRRPAYLLRRRPRRMRWTRPASGQETP